MFTKQTNTKLKTCVRNITKQQARIQEAQERVHSGSSWDVIGINLTLKSVKKKVDAEANKYYEALDAFLESMVEGTPQQDLIAMEDGISELKRGINKGIIEMVKLSSDLRLFIWSRIQETEETLVTSAAEEIIARLTEEKVQLDTDILDFILSRLAESVRMGYKYFLKTKVCIQV